MTTGLSMYDVHTVWLRWTYATVRTGGGSATAYKWTSTQKTRALSSHAKKLAFFWTRISSISTVLNKSQWYYRRISALSPEDYCTSCFKRVTCRPASCRRCAVAREGEGVIDLMLTGIEGVKNDILVDVINGS